MPHGSSESWPANIVLQDLWGLLHALCLEANFQFDIALRQTALFDGEMRLVTTSSPGNCTSRTSIDSRSSFLLSVPLFVLVLFFFSTASLLLSLPRGSTGEKRRRSCSSPLTFLIHHNFKVCARVLGSGCCGKQGEFMSRDGLGMKGGREGGVKVKVKLSLF